MSLPTVPASILEKIFSYESIIALEDIFEKAAHRQSDDELSRLNKDLLAVLQQKMNTTLVQCDVSPNGYNYIMRSRHLCFLINVHGIFCIFSSALLWEGEMRIQDFRWIEEDRLVLFDADYFGLREKETVICHYSNDENAFVLFEKQTILAEQGLGSRGNHENDSQDNWMGDDWMDDCW